ncbi:MAG TPA: response regulator [Burkholderiales bacterium]
MPAAGVTQKRVLVADDSKFVRNTFKSILSTTFEVLEAGDGETAWDAVAGDPGIVMVFTDLDMPRLNGFGLLSRIREAGEARIRELPVVVISGNEDPSVKERARAAGATDFISKSADAPEVLSRIDNLLRLVSASRTATHDPQLGTLTPHFLVTQGRKHYAHARRHGSDLSVLALRLDSYAEILRVGGKEIAALIIARIAKLILAKVRAEDAVARTAEDTFLVLAADTAAAQVRALGERLRRELAEANVNHRGQTLRFPSRIGVASLAQDPAESIEDLMRLALRRLEAAGAAAPAASPSAAPAALPAEIEAALARLEKVDWARVGAGAASQVMQRLQRIAAKLRR